MHNDEWFGFRAVLCRAGLATDELYIIVQTDDLSTRVGFDVSLGYLPRFVVEQTVRVTAPSHAAHIHSIEIFVSIN